MLVYPQPLQIPGRSGLLFPSRVWKAQYLEDERIFQDTIPEEQPDFSVSLMLDASASRLDSQESIASQGYIIAKSLSLCNIPLQVFSFLSLRGYTVLRLFSNYGEEGAKKNFRLLRCRLEPGRPGPSGSRSSDGRLSRQKQNPYSAY